MKWEEIYNNIATLAQGQGSYGRMKADLDIIAEEDPERFETIKQTMESLPIKDMVDLVMYFET